MKIRTLGVVAASVIGGAVMLFGSFSVIDLTLSDSATSTTSIDEPVADIAVTLDNGSVTVRPDPQATQMTVTINEHSGLVEPEVSVHTAGSKLVVTATCALFAGFNSTSQCWADVTVAVPTELAPTLVARTDSGAITAEGLATAELRSGSGSVSASDIAGDTTARTGSGSIVVESIAGDVVASNGSGDVSARSVAGDLEAGTGSGRVFVNDTAGNINAHSGSGDVIVYAASDDAVNLTISTGSGSREVTAATDPAASITVKIRSGSGNVKYLQ